MTCIRLALVSLVLASVACGGSSGGGDQPDSGGPNPMVDGSGPGTPDAGGTGTPDALGSGTDGGGTGTIDAPPPIMSITGMSPQAASRTVNTPLLIRGANIVQGATVILTNCDTAAQIDISSGATVSAGGALITAMLPADPNRAQGLYSVTVTNPDGQTDLLECSFRILAANPPTVTNVTPTSAFSGLPSDGVLSDQLVVISGTGFESTPSVRWQSVDGTRSYEAIVVGFVSSTRLTAVVPSETLSMVVGDYHVYVVNPDFLEGQWLVGGTTAGIFKITDQPAPRVTAITPERVENGSCGTADITLTGENFAAGATVSFVAPPGFSGTCTNQQFDGNGNKLCQMTITGTTATTITAEFTSCPGTSQPWPLVVTNPDGQRGYYYSVQVTPSSDGHLNQAPWSPLNPTLGTPRWKHGMVYGFDVFGHAFLYVNGGQNAAGNMLGNTEITEVDIFGGLSSFGVLQQYGSVGSPRVTNSLVKPRAGHTLLRAGRFLYAVGGALARTDVITASAGTTSVERSWILGWEEVPLPRLPSASGVDGLPIGFWYYQVSALGPWGESLPMREVVLRNLGGTIKVCWTGPAGATGYNVYRSLASDGRSGSAVLLATDVNPPDSCFVDDGAGALAPAPGKLRGAPFTGSRGVGTFTYRVAAVTAAGESQAGYPAAIVVTPADVVAGNGAVKLNWDSVPGATHYLLYRLDTGTGKYARVDTGTSLTTPTFTDNGTALVAGSPEPKAEIKPLPPGTLAKWTELTDTPLGTARDGLDGVVVRLPEGAASAYRLLVVGGRTTNNSASAYLTSAESAPVMADGTMGAWEAEDEHLTYPRAYYALVTTQDRNVTPFPPPPEEPPCPDLDGDLYIDCACAPPGWEPPVQDPPLPPGCDCVDTDPDINPAEEEICNDGIDQDCSGEDDTCGICITDADMDGSISQALCMGPDCCDSGFENDDVDTGDMIDYPGCSTTNRGQMHGGAIEACGNGIDEDCDGVDPPCGCQDDVDGDGHISLACGGDDCCDTGSDTSLGCTAGTAMSIHPGTRDVCENAIDEDCNGFDNICKVADAAATHGELEQSLMMSLLPEEVCVPGTNPIYVLAVFGQDTQLIEAGPTKFTGEGLNHMEACRVNECTGRLECTSSAAPCTVAGKCWYVQTQDSPASNTTYGMDAMLYFNFLFPFAGGRDEVIVAAGDTHRLRNATYHRFDFTNPLTAVLTTNVLGGSQSASSGFLTLRSHYQMSRLVSFLYAVGGWVDGGPTGTVERHPQ